MSKDIIKKRWISYLDREKEDAKMIEALKFYANTDNHVQTLFSPYGTKLCRSDVTMDGGEIARKALGGK